MINTRRATIDDLKEVAELFNLYRIFYGQSSTEEECAVFLHERLASDESIVLISFFENKLIGFTQLYPCFSSVSLKRQWILNDLFVKKEFRGLGVARRLISEAEKVAKTSYSNCKGLTLKTAVDNSGAQNLYESMGWMREEDFISYNLNFK